MNKIKSITSIEDLRLRLQTLPVPNELASAKAKIREPNLTKPPGSLGRLEEIVCWLSAWQGKHPPSLNHPKAKIFAGNHGVANEGVSAYPSNVTEQMVKNFKSGGAAINQICKTFDVDLTVFPINLNKPTENITKAPALTENQFLESIIDTGKKSETP